MKVVKVYGPLRKYLGQCRFEFVADTPAQAMKALCVNFPGLAQWLLDREAEGMAFRVTRGRDKITNEAPEGLVLPWSEREVFSIAPVIVGAGRGVGTILAGIALVGLAFITAGSSLAFSGLVLTSTATAATTSAAFAAYAGFAAGLGTLGIALIVGGVAQLISPMPSMGGLTSGKEAARLESFSFSGIVNTSKQGMAVPICYGRAFVGSAVISSGLDVDQVAV
jgi:predicted phage tail protein